MTASEPKMEISAEELDRLRIPVAYRDYCAHHFVRWQKCLRSKFFHWQCHDDEIQWEKCQYYEHRRIMRDRDLEVVENREAAGQ